jgi:AcrR family transcriptional regulator
MVDNGRVTRIPQQKRSIEKKKRILDAAFEVFGRQGYNNSSTLDIARAAGISVGTLYSYFKDKKGLFLECFKIYSDNVQERLLQGYDLRPESSALDVIEKTIDILIEVNNVCQSFHDEVLSLMYLDEDVRRFYFQQHDAVSNTIVTQLIDRKIVSPQNGREKVFLVIAMIESISREFIYNSATTLDRTTLIELCKSTVIAFGGLDRP